MEENEPTPPHPQVEIIELPTNTAFKGAYERDGFSWHYYMRGSKNDIFPEIRITNYRGAVSIVISCVTKDAPYRPHPNKVVNGTTMHSHGVCFMSTRRCNSSIRLKRLFIQYSGRQFIQESLRERERVKVDPFNTGFRHKLFPSIIDLDCVRLCFQVFLESPPYRSVSLEPVLSQPLYATNKPIPDLKSRYIFWLSRKWAPLTGGAQLCIFCEKMSKCDIEIRFHPQNSDREAPGTSVTSRNFKRVAFIIETSKLRPDFNILEPIEFNFQLKERSYEEVNNDPRSDQLLPLKSSERFKNTVHGISLKLRRGKCSKQLRVSNYDVLLAEILKSRGRPLDNFRAELLELPLATGSTKPTEPCKSTPNNGKAENLQPCLLEISVLHLYAEIESDTHTEHDLQTDTTHNLTIEPTPAELPIEVPKQSSTCNFLDTPNFATLLQDVLEVIKKDLDSTQIASNSTHTSELPSDPALFNVANMADPNSVTNSNMQQLNDFSHCEKLSYLSDLDSICVSELIPDMNCELKDFF